MDAYIVDAIRTPRGKGRPGGALSTVKPIDLFAGLLRALAERNGLAGDVVSDVALGCVTQTGEQGADLAKIAAIYAGWDDAIGGVTMNRFCASGLDALRYGALAVAAGGDEVVVTGGVESMSRVPMFSDGGAWFADAEVAKRTGFIHMGVAADLLATLAGLDRPALDAVAVRSHARAARAREEGRFGRSLVPVRDSAGELLLDHDENVRPGTTVESLARFEAAFVEPGERGGDALALSRYPELEAVRHVHHVGVAPALADGASAVLVANSAGVSRVGRPARARIRSLATVSVEPVLMLTGNVAGTERALAMAGLTVEDVDVFEVNESFAAVPLHYAAAVGIEAERLNQNGSAIAFGHPLGATGGMLVSMALDELERADGTLALVSICGGGGVAVTAVLERV